MENLTNIYVFLVLTLAVGNAGIVGGFLYVDKKKGERAKRWEKVTFGLVLLFTALSVILYLNDGTGRTALWVALLFVQYILHFVLGLQWRRRSKRRRVCPDE